MGNRESIVRGAVVAMIAAASLACVPPGVSAAEYFDPPKRLVWAVGFLVLALGAFRAGGAPRSAPLLPAVLLGVWMVARTLGRADPGVEPGVLANWMAPVLAFALGQCVSPSRRRTVWGTFAGVTVLQSVLMISQYFGLDALFPATTAAMEYRPGRMLGTIGYQNQAVDCVALCSASALVLARRPLWRLAWLAPAAAVAVLSANRGGLLSLIAAGAAVWVLDVRLAARTRRSVVLASLAGLMAIGAVGWGVSRAPHAGERFRQLVENPVASPAVGSRLLMADVAWQMWAERPLSGWGAGEYAFQYLPRLGALMSAAADHATLRTAVYAREAHNDYVQFAAEFGFVGVLLAGAVLWGGLRRARRLIRADPREGGALVYIAVYMGVAALVSFPWQAAMAGPLAGLTLGMLTGGAGGSSRSGSGVPLAERGSRVLWLAVSILSVAWSAADLWWSIRVPQLLAGGRLAEAGALWPEASARYQAMIGAEQARRGRYAESARTLASAGFRHRDVLLWNNLGRAYAMQGKWREARDVYADWCRTGIAHRDALWNLSIAQEQLGEWDRAGRSVERLVALWPETAADQVERLSVLQWKGGRPDQALSTARSYESACRRSGLAFPARLDNLVGAIHLAAGRYAEAEDRFRAALAKDPGLGSAWANLDRVRMLRSARP